MSVMFDDLDQLAQELEARVSESSQNLIRDCPIKLGIKVGPM